MFVVTLNKTSLKKVGAGALCCALVIFSAFLGRYISTRTVAAAAGMNRIESAQDIQTWFTGYGLDVDGTSITADKVKIPRKWDDSFSAFNGVVQQSGMDLTRYKGKTVDPRTAFVLLCVCGIPASLAAGTLCTFGASALQVSGRLCSAAFGRGGQAPSTGALLGQFARMLFLLLPLCGAAVGMLYLAGRAKLI